MIISTFSIDSHDDGHEVRCIMSIENWSQWMLSFPVVYTQYGDFEYGFHEREIFPAHREIVVSVNELDSITGSSGTIAWELGHKNIHFIVTNLHLNPSFGGNNIFS